jgi:hypothetical protein
MRLRCIHDSDGLVLVVGRATIGRQGHHWQARGRKKSSQWKTATCTVQVKTRPSPCRVAVDLLESPTRHSETSLPGAP